MASFSRVVETVLLRPRLMGFAADCAIDGGVSDALGATVAAVVVPQGAPRRALLGRLAVSGGAGGDATGVQLSVSGGTCFGSLVVLRMSQAFIGLLVEVERATAGVPKGWSSQAYSEAPNMPCHQ
jgi:hypothetical protein